MKNRLTRKLFLSIAALGVTAATLTTSTFAWYTANSEAKVTQIQASTESKGSDSLFVAAAQTYDATVAQTFGGYGAEATPKLTAGDDTSSKTKKLRPVCSNVTSGTRTYKQLTGATTSTGTDKDTPVYATDEDNYDFIEFVIRVRSGQKLENATPLYFSAFNLTSTQDDALQVALASGGSTGIKEAGKYGADIVKALKLDISSDNAVVNTAAQEATAVYGEKATGTTTRNSSSVSATTYGFENLATGTDTNIATTGANALGYYNTIMGTALNTPSSGYNGGTEVTKLDTASSERPLVVATLPATQTGMDFSIIEIRFVLYLDGWDNYCYDVMQNQSINFSFTLTTNASESVMQLPAASNNSGNQGD